MKIQFTVGHGKISNNPGDNEDELQVGSQVHAGTDGVTCTHFIPGSTNCFLTKGLFCFMIYQL